MGVSIWPHPRCHLDLPQRHLHHLSLSQGSFVDLSRLRTWLSLSPSSELGRGGYSVGTVGGRETSSTGGGRGGKSASSLVPSSCSGGPLRVPQYGGGGGSSSSSGS